MCLIGLGVAYSLCRQFFCKLRTDQALHFAHIVVYSAGFKTDSVYQYIHHKDYHQLPPTALYYASHYPFLRDYGTVDRYIHLHTTRTVVLIRDVLDAGYSEYIR